jgi:hypothetical protein
MRIYFDFDLYGDSAIDAHIIDIMLALKREVRNILSNYIADIEKDGGYILITLKPGTAAIWYLLVDDEKLWNIVQPILNSTDLERVIRTLGRSDLN